MSFSSRLISLTLLLLLLKEMKKA